MRHVLLLDDEPNVLSALNRSLRQIAGPDALTTECLSSPKEAIQRLAESAFDLIIADYHMPEMDGVAFLRIAREVQPDSVRMMLSASAEFKTILGAINEAEAFRFISKPWTTEELREVFTQACERHDQILAEKQLANEARQLHGDLSRDEAERQRLEALEPGITYVRRGPDGGVLLDD